jgi:hypothetical protein
MEAILSSETSPLSEIRSVSNQKALLVTDTAVRISNPAQEEIISLSSLLRFSVE